MPSRASLAFAASEVCVDGRWRRAKWVGQAGGRGASYHECEAKFGRWASHLRAGCNGGLATIEEVRVQRSWWQNTFIFAIRPQQQQAQAEPMPTSSSEAESTTAVCGVCTTTLEMSRPGTTTGASAIAVLDMNIIGMIILALMLAVLAHWSCTWCL